MCVCVYTCLLISRLLIFITLYAPPLSVHSRSGDRFVKHMGVGVELPSVESWRLHLALATLNVTLA